MSGLFTFIIIALLYYKAMTIGKNRNKNKKYYGTDWNAYERDIRNGIDCVTQLKKSERGDYWITDCQHDK